MPDGQGKVGIPNLNTNDDRQDAGQSSHDEWKSPKPQAKWKEMSLEMDALGSALKEETHTWNKSCKESVKRETE